VTEGKSSSPVAWVVLIEGECTAAWTVKLYDGKQSETRAPRIVDVF
jgi:hypothetical protein